MLDLLHRLDGARQELHAGHDREPWSSSFWLAGLVDIYAEGETLQHISIICIARKILPWWLMS